MHAEIQTLVRCGFLASMGALSVYLLGLMPVGPQAKQGFSIGIIVITIALMLRLGGVL